MQTGGQPAQAPRAGDRQARAEQGQGSGNGLKTQKATGGHGAIRTFQQDTIAKIGEVGLAITGELSQRVWTVEEQLLKAKGLIRLADVEQQLPSRIGGLIKGAVV